MIQNKKAGDCLSVYLKGEIDHFVASDLRKEIEALVRPEEIRRLHLDFTQVSFIDSSGIGLIIGRYKTMKERGGSVSASGMNEMVYRLFRLAGLHRIIIVTENGGGQTHE